MFPYNPQDVIVTWGPVPMLGFAEDSIVMVEFDVAAAELVVGAKGDTAVTISSNIAGKAHCTFLQGAPVNAALSALCAQTRPRRAPLITYPFIVADLGGTTLAVGPEAFLEKVPPIDFKKGQTPREWTWIVPAWTKLNNGGVR